VTAVFYTVDTELSPGLHQRGLSLAENLNAAVLGITNRGEWGIRYQIERLNAHGLKGVFFVEALCAYLGDADILKRIVEPVLQGGHEVQLHLHTEWLKWIDKDPVSGRRGENIFDFDGDDQYRLLEMGLNALTQAGAPTPTAFRAGNYGANNDTLRALGRLGIRYDTSYNYPYLQNGCRLEFPRSLHRPAELEGVVEVPITFFEDYPNHSRPLQLAAVSSSEMEWVIDSCVASDRPTAVIVSHSFELLNRKRQRANKILVRRFNRLCSVLQQRQARAPTMTFAAFDRARSQSMSSEPTPLRSNVARTAVRMLEQSLGNLLYDAA
jgi:peptidoglycan/xylan/chitin deacetylase (PgdA/CDA1 family)